MLDDDGVACFLNALILTACYCSKDSGTHSGTFVVDCLCELDAQYVGNDLTPELGLRTAAADGRACDLKTHLLSALERITECKCNAFEDSLCHVETCGIHGHAYEHRTAVRIVKR